ncbi:hypothetical protein SAMN03159496_01604 [Rhizobium sp. NFR07]|uniref:hypothetical protein n=1 Tax=Rhizobium sp. NFR07 TaxID=1566262 RepID=UPI0008E17879|nr:hypothetical protein [Rhizobium sp. NFR07]SFB05771.1 hypothetical protein SAMN03159496_01604 [Rhizobium sp. NFR07]
MEASSEIISTIEFGGRFKRVTGVEYHDEKHLRLKMGVDEDWGVALVDIERGEVVSLKLVRASSSFDKEGQSDVWFRIDNGIAMLRGKQVNVWPDLRDDAFTAYPIANPDHFASDPAVLADDFRRKPSVLHVEPMSGGAAIALCSDNFYQRGGRYLARLEFRQDAFRWVGAYRQIEEPELKGHWTDRTFSLHETPMIHGIRADGEDVFCVTRGGTATMLNHGPAFQTNVVICYGMVTPVVERSGGFSLKSLFSRNKPGQTELPGFAFKDAVLRPEGGVIFNRATGQYAVKVPKKNRLQFYDVSGGQPLSELALTPKRSLGDLKHDKARYALSKNLLAVCGQDKINLCRITFPHPA